MSKKAAAMNRKTELCNDIHIFLASLDDIASCVCMTLYR